MLFLKKLKKKYLYIFIPFIVFLLGKSTQKQINESMEFQVVLRTVFIKQSKGLENSSKKG